MTPEAVLSISLLATLLGVVLVRLLETYLLWRRFTRACGGAASAMAVLEAAEDVELVRGFRAARNRGWL